MTDPIPVSPRKAFTPAELDRMRRSTLLISFSGGETSAYMTWWMLQNWRPLFKRIVTVFANTGRENEETLRFIHRCDKQLKFDVVWVEAVMRPKGVGSTFRVVDFKSACRDGSVFEAAIRKKGIPNPMFPWCSIALKRDIIDAYMRSLGLKKLHYYTAIGIRADEFDRQSDSAVERQVLYPLIAQHPVTKPMINRWWSERPFRLGLKGYEGNCKTCWKKSFRKHMTIMQENPHAYDWDEEMVAKYGEVGGEFNRPDDPPPEGYRRTFFRDNKTVEDLREMVRTRKPTWKRADDDAQVYDADYDTGGGCEESCEID